MLVAIGVILLMLKLAGVISWAWWIVLIPFYPLVAVLLFAGFCFIMSGVAAILGVKQGR